MDIAGLVELSQGNLAALRAHVGATSDLDAHLPASPMVAPSMRDTLLTFAVRHRQAAAVQLLLDSGARVEATTSTGVAPLMFAGAMNVADCAQLLLKAGAVVDIRQSESTRSFTPCAVACWQGHLQVARLLLDAGAAVDRKFSFGESSPSASSR